MLVKAANNRITLDVVANVLINVDDPANYGSTKYTFRLVLPPQIETISADSFHHLSGIKEVVMQEGVKIIKSGAFVSCTSLKKLVIPSSLVTIEEAAFYDLPDLEEIVVADGNPNYYVVGGCLIEKATKKIVLSTRKAKIPLDMDIRILGSGAIQSTMKDIVLPDSIVYIERGAIDNCDPLEKQVYDGISYLRSESNPYFVVCGVNEDVKYMAVNKDARLIADGAFENSEQLSVCVLPREMRYIPAYAFADCAKLKSVTFNKPKKWSAVEEIKDVLFGVESAAFAGCEALEEVELPDNVTFIGDNAFYDCEKIVSIELPDEITQIGAWAFKNCRSLKTIKMPTSLTKIELAAFESSGIEKAIFPEGLVEIELETFKECEYLRKVVLPSTLKYIDRSAFECCPSLADISFPKGLKVIERAAFLFTNLTKIVLPSSLEEIGEGAFGLTPLHSISFDGESERFSCECGLVDLKKSTLIKAVDLRVPQVERIGDDAFLGVENSGTIHIPSSVKTIGRGAFAQCENVTEIIMGENVVEIGEYAFAGTNVKTDYYKGGYYVGSEKNPYYVMVGFDASKRICIAPGTKIIADRVFEEKTVKSICIPASVIQIGQGNFTDDAITSFEVEEGSALVAIYDNQIQSEKFSSFTISDSIERFEMDLSDNLQRTGNYYKGALYIGNSENPFLILYKYFNNFAGICMVHKDTRVIASHAFEESNIYSVVFEGKSLVAIEEKAFFKCTDLCEITIPDTVKRIANNAFAFCTSLRRVGLPASLEEIGDFAFTGIDIREIKLPERLKYIGAHSFEFCDHLTSIYVPKSVEFINVLSFAYCYSLEKISLPARIRANRLFFDCFNLNTIDYYEDTPADK